MTSAASVRRASYYAYRRKEGSQCSQVKMLLWGMIVSLHETEADMGGTWGLNRILTLFTITTRLVFSIRYCIRSWDISSFRSVLLAYSQRSSLGQGTTPSMFETEFHVSFLFRTSKAPDVSLSPMSRISPNACSRPNQYLSHGGLSASRTRPTTPEITLEGQYDCCSSSCLLLPRPMYHTHDEVAYQTFSWQTLSLTNRRGSSPVNLFVPSYQSVIIDPFANNDASSSLSWKKVYHARPLMDDSVN